MSMVYQIGKGYYGVESSGPAMAPSVLARMNQAYAEAMRIPDEAIVIREYNRRTSSTRSAGSDESKAKKRV